MANFSIKKKSKLGISTTIFYACLVAIPTLQFIIFYIIVNFNSFLLAFRNYDYATNSYSFAGLENFVKVFAEMQSFEFAVYFKNTIKTFLVMLLIAFPLPILFSYYIYKNGLGGKIFKVVLFLPQVISGLVIIIVYKYFVDLGIPKIINGIFGTQIKGLYVNPETSFATVLVYCVWGSFGTKLLLYLSSMYSIDNSVVEAAKLDGTTYLQELWYITIPQIFPTLTTYLVLTFTAFFTDQAGLFAFDGQFVNAKMQTIGYNIYIRTLRSNTNATNWPILATYGVIFTIITAPITFLMKRLLTKFGPGED